MYFKFNPIICSGISFEIPYIPGYNAKIRKTYMTVKLLFFKRKAMNTDKPLNVLIIIFNNVPYCMLNVCLLYFIY